MTIEHSPVTGAEAPADGDTPLAALIRFYRGFNGRDLEQVMQNWAQTEVVAMSNPLGDIKRGRKAIRSVYERLFNGPAQVYVEFYDYSLTVSDSMFCAVGRERGVLSLGANRLELAIRTSRIYQRIGAQWLQVHHHGSMDKPGLLAAYQAAVRGMTPPAAGQRSAVD